MIAFVHYLATIKKNKLKWNILYFRDLEDNMDSKHKQEF